MIRRATLWMKLLHWIRRQIPGVGDFSRGRKAFGALLFLYFITFPVIILLNLHEFAMVIESMALSAFLLVMDFDHHTLFVRGDVIEHYVATLFLVFMPVLLWWLNRRHMRVLAEERDIHELSQWALAWREFKKNRIAAGALIFIIVLYTSAFLCPYIAPHHPNAFQDGWSQNSVRLLAK